MLTLCQPADKSFEILENYKKDCAYDVFFAMSHGVHRGSLNMVKMMIEIFINKLIKFNKEIVFDVYVRIMFNRFGG